MGAQPQGDIMGSVVFLGILFFFGYFLLWRPQSKHAKEHENLLKSIQTGDEVVTTSGIMGKVQKISKEGYVELLIAKDTIVLLQKTAIMSLLPKGTCKQL